VCGRFTQQRSLQEIVARFGVEVAALFDGIKPRYNVAPAQAAPVIDGRELRAMRWGLVPHWAKDESIGNRLINARAETLAEKPSFREAFRRRRCLIPVYGVLPPPSGDDESGTLYCNWHFDL